MLEGYNLTVEIIWERWVEKSLSKVVSIFFFRFSGKVEKFPSSVLLILHLFQHISWRRGEKKMEKWIKRIFTKFFHRHNGTLLSFVVSSLCFISTQLTFIVVLYLESLSERNGGVKWTKNYRVNLIKKKERCIVLCCNTILFKS